jgi:MurNAc alpha-1-phosphate uridylyltransferase
MSMVSPKAIILAAGKGTRMMPLTRDMPKPLVPVCGTPLIDWSVKWLRSGGVRQMVVNTAYLAETLHAHLAQDRDIVCSYEGTEPLETGGGVAHALPHLGDAPFIAMNSDAIFQHRGTHPLTRLLQTWDDPNMDFLMLLVPCADALGWHGNGDFNRTESGMVRRPAAGEQAAYVFSGVELIHPRVFTDLPDGAFSLSRLWERSRDASGIYTRVGSIVLDGKWINVGDIHARAHAETLLCPPHSGAG